MNHPVYVERKPRKEEEEMSKQSDLYVVLESSKIDYVQVWKFPTKPNKYVDRTSQGLPLIL